MNDPLHDYLKSRGITQAAIPVLAAQIDALVMTRAKAEIAGRTPQAPIKPPLPELTPMQVQAVIKRGKERPWSKRPTHRMDSFKWVADNYKEWIPGLLQSHLKVADPLLYHAFAKRMGRNGGLPNWLDVPSEADANLRKLTNPQERDKLLASRQLKRLGMQIARAVHCP
jgi:hypothetical protein